MVNILLVNFTICLDIIGPNTHICLVENILYLLTFLPSKILWEYAEVLFSLSNIFNFPCTVFERVLKKRLQHQDKTEHAVSFNFSRPYNLAMEKVIAKI